MTDLEVFEASKAISKRAEIGRSLAFLVIFAASWSETILLAQVLKALGL